MGLVFAVVGMALLAFAGLPQSPYYEGHYESQDIPAASSRDYWFDVEAGTRLEFSFSANSTVDFCVLDSENYEKARAQESCDSIYSQQDTTTASFGFETSKTDKYHCTINNLGDDAVRVSVTQSASYGRFSAVSWGGAGLVAAGAVIAFVGYRGKPKISSAPRESREGESR